MKHRGPLVFEAEREGRVADEEATRRRIADRWVALETWAAGPRPTASDVALVLIPWLGRVRDRARAGGWGPQWERWIAWDGARRLGTPPDAAELYGLALDLGVAERAANEQGYQRAPGSPAATDLAPHPAATAEARAAAAVVAPFDDAIDWLRKKERERKAEETPWWQSGPVHVATGAALAAAAWVAWRVLR